VTPGERIRQRRFELNLKPSQIERISDYFSVKVQERRCVISHSILSGIESGAIPSFYKLLSLAYCLRVTGRQIVEWYGIDIESVLPLLRQRAISQVKLQGPPHNVPPREHFPLRWPSEPPTPKTELYEMKGIDIPAKHELRFRYARIGAYDDSMMDVLPAGSIVQIDTDQRQVASFPWRTIWHRPIFLVWHTYGHACRWCQQDGADLFLIAHPASHFPILRFRTPRDANIVGRVVRAWSADQETIIEFPADNSTHFAPAANH
jgi:transcriptional regulator with XRE-family HTH domain